MNLYIHKQAQRDIENLPIDEKREAVRILDIMESSGQIGFPTKYSKSTWTYANKCVRILYVKNPDSCLRVMRVLRNNTILGIL